ncbi:MAG: choice-of-anchor tandem repeat GloVer-containing protein [Bryobacteraceae bacterium]|jgi:hypothetical protein
MGESGALYGSAGGTIFELTPPASPGNPWTETTIGTEPYLAGPQAGLVIGAGGVLYGTTLTGGNYRHGSVFEFAPPGTPGGAWTQTDIYSFYESPSVVGISPYATQLIGKNGVLYGTSTDGGTSGLGTVFVLLPPAAAGRPWTVRVLQDFTDASGGQPQGALIAVNGALYARPLSAGLRIREQCSS